MGWFKFSKMFRSARRLRKELTSCMRGEPTDCDAPENAPERPPSNPSPSPSVTSLDAPIPPLPSTSANSKVCSPGATGKERDGDAPTEVDKSMDEAEPLSSPENIEIPSTSDDVVTTPETEKCEQRSVGGVKTESSLQEVEVSPIAGDNQSEMEAGNTQEEIQVPPVDDDMEDEKTQSEVEYGNTEGVQESPVTDAMEPTAIVQGCAKCESVVPETQVHVCSSPETRPEGQLRSDAEKQVEETFTGTSVDPAEGGKHEAELDGERESTELPQCVSDIATPGSVPESSGQCLNDACVKEVMTPKRNDSDQDMYTQDMSDGQCVEGTLRDQTDGVECTSTPSSDHLDKVLEQTGKKRLPSHQALMSISQREIVRGQRSDSSAFEIKLVRGFLGLGLTLGSDDFKEVVVQKIGLFSPAATQEGLRVGDRILKINDHSVIGKSPSQAQRLLGEVRWGEEVCILAMPQQDTVIFRWVEELDAGIITMKLNTAFDNPLGIEVEGGSDTESPYIRIKYIKPGSVAEKCGLLKTGDELVQIGDYPIVGMTHFEAVEVIGHIYEPIIITVQRRERLEIPEHLTSQKTM